MRSVCEQVNFPRKSQLFSFYTVVNDRYRYLEVSVLADTDTSVVSVPYRSVSTDTDTYRYFGPTAFSKNNFGKRSMEYMSAFIN